MYYITETATKAGVIWGRNDIDEKGETRTKDGDNQKWKMEMTVMLFKMQTLLKEQNEQIQELKMQAFKKTVDNDICNMIRKELDATMTNHHLQTTKLLEGFLKEQKRRETEQLDYLLANLSQQLSKQVIEHLQPCISHEIKMNVVPPVLNIFQSLQDQLDLHYKQKLATLDNLVKTNIAKLFSNKQVADSLSTSIVTIIKPSLESCYKDMIGTTLIPSWERACTTMFQQIHNTFTQGTKECKFVPLLLILSIDGVRVRLFAFNICFLVVVSARCTLVGVRSRDSCAILVRRSSYLVVF